MVMMTKTVLMTTSMMLTTRTVAIYNCGDHGDDDEGPLTRHRGVVLDDAVGGQAVQRGKVLSDPEPTAATNSALFAATDARRKIVESLPDCNG
jgi:hypothetical protein